MGHMQWEPKTPYKASDPKIIELMYLKERYEIMNLSTDITICRIIKLLKPNY